MKSSLERILKSALELQNDQAEIQQTLQNVQSFQIEKAQVANNQYDNILNKLSKIEFQITHKKSVSLKLNL